MSGQEGDSGHQESDFTEGRGGGYAQMGSAEEPRHRRCQGTEPGRPVAATTTACQGRLKDKGIGRGSGAAWCECRAT